LSSKYIQRPRLGDAAASGALPESFLFDTTPGFTQDRVDSATLIITHDFLATMLGTDRPTVSLAAGILQNKQIIEYTRGALQILSRAKLEECACECYEVIQQYNNEIGLK
jgi:hypothetical protein